MSPVRRGIICIWQWKMVCPASLPALIPMLNPVIKVAAAVFETATRIRIAFASACPDAAIFKAAAINLSTASP